MTSMHDPVVPLGASARTYAPETDTSTDALLPDPATISTALSLFGRALELGVKDWGSTFRVLLLFIGLSGCLFGLFYGLHLCLGMSPWISGAATLTGTGGGSYAAIRCHRRKKATIDP